MIYLIDFENVHSDGLKGIEQLGKKDKCYIFYSEHAGVLTFNMHKRITESRYILCRGTGGNEKCA